LALEAAGHSNTLEVTWSVIPAILCVFMFYFGVVGFMDLRTSPADANEVTVRGYKWAWEFEYKNGGTSQELHAVVGEATRLVMYSDDVLHSFFVPNFRVKQDVVPGRYTSLWFEPTVAGEHQIFCTEYCGTRHSDMLAKVIVHESREDYEQAVGKLMNKYEGLNLAQSGELIYKAKGCNGCHSIDGSRLVGPSFKGTWGSQRKFTDGSALDADENYIRNSVLYPQQKVVAGYAPVMPSYQGQLSDDEVGFIIEYIKSLK
ncbi:MAG: c-type cytochrome, partial [Myxococcota bacterium]